MTIFLDLNEVLEYRHRSRSSHFRDIENGLCTTPINVGPRSVAWLRTELETLRAAVIAGKSQDEIKQIVRELQDFRQKNVLERAGVGL